MYFFAAPKLYLSALDFAGMDPTGVADSTTAIRNAFAALYASKGTLFFPAGSYKVTDTIDFSGGAGQGRIEGAGRDTTVIFGTVNNGFIFSCPNEQLGVQEMCNMTVTNGSTVLGTGAVRWLSNATTSTFRNMVFSGQIGLDIAWNSFQVGVINCQAGPTTANQLGTAGVVSNGCTLMNFRATNYDTAFLGMGNNGHALINNSVEVCAIGFLLGMFQGWASACTISGNILNVGGEISPTISLSSTQPSFIINSILYGDNVTGHVWGDPLSGPTIVADGNPAPISSYAYNSGTGLVTLAMLRAATFTAGESITISDLNIAGLNITTTAVSVSGGGFTVTYTGPTGQVGSASGGGNLVDNALTGIGGAGTYRLSNSFTVSTPQVMFTRYGFNLKGGFISGGETEGCYTGIYVNSIGAFKISEFGLGGVVGEAAKPGGTNGYTAKHHMYISTMDAATIENITIGNGTFDAAIYIDSAGSTINSKISEVLSSPTDNAVSDGAATISGTTMHINSTVSGAWGIGMTVTGIGVSANTTITDFTDATHFVVSPSQTVAATTLTGAGGAAWSLPLTSSSAAGLQILNSNSPFFGFVFNLLPGQAGCVTNIVAKEGMEYDITDGQKSGGGTAAALDIVAGGSSGRYKVRYNGTNWIRVG